MARIKKYNSIEELDKAVIQQVKEHLWEFTDPEPIHKDLYDIHKAMWILHDIVAGSENESLIAIIAKTIIKLNALRAKIKGEKKTYK